ncbi:AraC family transcriptional regulator [Methylobacterium sp. 77]|uniref:AraC family transcriptional regulator n=1 Tax=Methylobacterium sp. 77 TaxID=1101192 RepID=UPI0003633662|nr:AraC family transcriptional regulator [Methylobacterium sp. 77]
MPYADAINAALPVTDATLVRLASGRIAHAGLPVHALLREVGLPTSVMDHPEPVGAIQEASFLELASRVLEDGLLGFHMAKETDGRAFGPLHYLLASSADLGDALSKQAHYLPTVNRGLTCSVERPPSLLALEFHTEGIDRDLCTQEIEFWITSVLRMSRKLTTLELNPSRIEFRHEHRGDISEMRDYFGRTPVFQAERDSIVFDDQVAGLPLMQTDPYLNAFLTRFHDELLTRSVSESNSIAVRVASLLTPLLAQGQGNVTLVATTLGMSARTLGRRLAGEGVSFRSILDQLRADLALRYVRDTTMPVSQIAWRLGYRDPSAFIVAFKRWTGRVPLAVRRESRA